LTRALYGQDLPKQFAVLAGRHSLMQTTVERAQLLTTLDRISVIVSAHHEKVARLQLAPYPGVELVVQPKNLDTAPGLLLPLVRVLRRDADARVIFLPSDHYIANPTPLVEALLATRKRSLRHRLAMVGVAPTAPEIEYGWIVRGKRIARSAAFEIEHFREKPPQHIADELWRSGGLWNTFIQAAPARLLWQLARDYLPVHATALTRYAAAIGRADEQGALEAAYRTMPAASFSRDVLDHASSLAVVPLDGSGWSDWGSPQRVFASLAGTREHDMLLERIRRDREPSIAIAS
jgi:mannose-1-phosphate guanylyltransferase